MSVMHQLTNGRCHILLLDIFTLASYKNFLQTQHAMRAHGLMVIPTLHICVVGANCEAAAQRVCTSVFFIHTCNAANNVIHYFWVCIFELPQLQTNTIQYKSNTFQHFCTRAASHGFDLEFFSQGVRFFGWTNQWASPAKYKLKHLVSDYGVYSSTVTKHSINELQTTALS